MTPGTISNATPASSSASISSPPRPKISGSPPLSRTTRWPELAAPDQEGVDLGLAHEMAGALLADIDQLGRRVGQRQDARADQPVVDHDLGLAQQARGLEGQQLGIAGAGSDQIDDAGAAALVHGTRLSPACDRRGNRAAPRPVIAATRPRAGTRSRPPAARHPAYRRCSRRSAGRAMRPSSSDDLPVAIRAGTATGSGSSRTHGADGDEAAEHHPHRLRSAGFRREAGRPWRSAAAASPPA